MRATGEELEDLQTCTKHILDARANFKLAEAERYIILVRALVHHGLQPEDWQICLACGIIRPTAESACVCASEAEPEADPATVHELASHMR